MIILILRDKPATQPSIENIFWVLVSEPGFFLGLGAFPWKFNSSTRNEAKERHSLLDTMFDYICYFGPPGKYLYLSPQTPKNTTCRPAYVVGVLDLFYRYFPGGPR